jgi:hypothetical protein
MTPSMFDEQFNFVTSAIFSPWWLACIRLLFAFYTLFVTIFSLVWSAKRLEGSSDTVDSYFSYFTNLSYVGICAYFFASAVQTFAYHKILNLNQGKKADYDHLSTEYYPLQHWPWILRYLHGLLFTTVVTFPFIVTIAYWVILSSASTFSSPFSSWSNISKHVLNSVLPIFEITFTNAGPLRWLDMITTVVILESYLGVAYITHATQGIYTYDLLDPKKNGKLLPAYIIGIAVVHCIVFLIVTGVIHLRDWIIKRNKHQGPRLIYSAEY